jgi:DNA sulfur modification protein DndD
MKIKKIKLHNYRQYYGINEIDLNTDSDKNIILIGGMNGYGKTNLLLAFVWCLYGEKISKTDSLFRKKIHKDGNYPKYLKNTLNKDARKEGKSKYFVEIEFADIDIPDAFNTNSSKNGLCTIKRSVDTESLEETLSVSVSGQSDDLLHDEEDKINFINDYLIPLDATKFVFFDAEKIAQMAELSTREEGELMNDALGNILGLDIYENLVDDLQLYSDNLKKEGATGNIKDQIIDVENTEKLKKAEIQKFEKEIAEHDEEITQLQNKINQYNSFITNNIGDIDSFQNIDELYKQKIKLEEEISNAEERFTEISELIPFAFVCNLLEETKEHLESQEKFELANKTMGSIDEQSERFVEQLFNRPEYPPEDDLPFSAKSFYAQKAKKVIKQILSSKDDFEEELPFYHDITNSDKKLLEDTFSLIQGRTNKSFEISTKKLIELNNELNETNRKIRRIESETEEDEILDYRDRKMDAITKCDKHKKEKGVAEFQIKELENDIEQLRKNKKVLLKKSAISKQRQEELDLLNKYVDLLNEFIVQEKEQKADKLSSNILKELRLLMHKLEGKDSDFITNVSVKSLPDNEGLKITLYDTDNNPFKKESLSEGEKQLYISSLIKALLNEAIQDFPIVIDTPLGRLDKKHIKNILEHFYPNLANQVILMTTSSEIPPARKKIIEDQISKSYLLINKNNKTSFKKGYFGKYEN